MAFGMHSYWTAEGNTFRWMFKAAVSKGPHDFWLEEVVIEGGGV